MGTHLFGCKFCEKSNGDDDPQCDRKNFDSLLWSLVTVFQVCEYEKFNNFQNTHTRIHKTLTEHYSNHTHAPFKQTWHKMAENSSKLSKHWRKYTFDNIKSMFHVSTSSNWNMETERSRSHSCLVSFISIEEKRQHFNWFHSSSQSLTLTLNQNTYQNLPFRVDFHLNQSNQLKLYNKHNYDGNSSKSLCVINWLETTKANVPNFPHWLTSFHILHKFNHKLIEWMTTPWTNGIINATLKWNMTRFILPLCLSLVLSRFFSNHSVSFCSLINHTV